MSEECKCPYYDKAVPACRNPENCDYPFYCPILEEKKKNDK